MKTNIRLLLALAAMLAVPALSAQPRGTHHSSRGGRPEHHSSVSNRPSSGLKHGSSGSSSHADARPGKPDAKPSRPDGRITSRPGTPRPDMHRPAPSVRPDAHRPAPPVHHRHHVTVLPPHAVRRYFNGLLYYFWDNCYYRYRDNAYYVCDPPIGAIVYELPDTYDIITLNGKRYYKVYNTLYDLVVDAYGKPAFEVVGYLNG